MKHRGAHHCEASHGKSRSGVLSGRWKGFHRKTTFSSKTPASFTTRLRTAVRAITNASLTLTRSIGNQSKRSNEHLCWIRIFRRRTQRCAKTRFTTDTILTERKKRGCTTSGSTRWWTNLRDDSRFADLLSGSSPVTHRQGLVVEPFRSGSISLHENGTQLRVCPHAYGTRHFFYWPLLRTIVPPSAAASGRKPSFCCQGSLSYLV